MIGLLVHTQESTTLREHIDAMTAKLIAYGVFPKHFAHDSDLHDDELTENLLLKIDESDHPSLIRFDGECIECPEDYEDLADSLFEAAGAEKYLTAIKADINHKTGRAGIAFKIGNRVVKKTWLQRSDWVAEEFLNFVSAVLRKIVKKEFITLPTQDQCCNFMLIESSDKNVFSEGLRFLSEGFSAKELFQTRLISWFFVCPIGFVITTLALWYPMGFVKALGLSFAFWLFTFIAGFIHASSKFNEHEEQNEDIQALRSMAGNDPSTFGSEIRKALAVEFDKLKGSGEFSDGMEKSANA